jgi:hypothetical protein
MDSQKQTSEVVHVYKTVYEKATFEKQSTNEIVKKESGQGKISSDLKSKYRGNVLFSSFDYFISIKILEML